MKHISFSANAFDYWRNNDVAAIMRLVGEYDSFEDWPWPLIYKGIDEAFPEAKFILTTRQCPDVWFASLCRHAERHGPTIFRKLIYGFEMNTEEEIAELWIAAASAAGVDISRELLEKGIVKRFVPKVIQRIAARASGEIVEKWAGRLIPIASSAMGCALNYYFVRAWGERARAHFRAKHLVARQKFAEEQASLPTR